MIISHEHRFIFVKTAKTAGTSIEVFLSQHCGPDDVVTPITPPVEGHRARNYQGRVNPLPLLLRKPGKLIPALRQALVRGARFYNHIPAVDVRERVPRKVWQGYFKFCVERNPWDKTLSHYHMTAARSAGPLTLDEYLAKGRFPINYFRYTDRSGETVIVDRVVRYEHLMSDLAEVFARVNVPFAGDLGVRAKAEYRTERAPYQTVFNSAQRAIVEKAFAREVALHGYVFEQNAPAP